MKATNSIIKKILKKKHITELNNEQKYFLEANRLKLVETTNSNQGYLALESENGRQLVISKDYDKKSGIFSPTTLVEYIKDDKVDLLNFIKTPEKKYDNSCNKYQIAKGIKRDIKTNEKYITSYIASLEDLHTKYLESVKKIEDTMANRRNYIEEKKLEFTKLFK